MIKTLLKIEGMACGMCESHVNDAVRKTFKLKKVSSSHKKGVTEIVSESPLDEERPRLAIEDSGYKVLDIRKESYEKKGFAFLEGRPVGKCCEGEFRGNIRMRELC